MLHPGPPAGAVAGIIPVCLLDVEHQFLAAVLFGALTHLGGLVLAAGGIAWLLGHPASYRLCYFIAANLLLGAFNLLPIHGLDGWQINSNLGILFHFKIQTQKHSCVN